MTMGSVTNEPDIWSCHGCPDGAPVKDGLCSDCYAEYADDMARLEAEAEKWETK